MRGAVLRLGLSQVEGVAEGPVLSTAEGPVLSTAEGPRWVRAGAVGNAMELSGAQGLRRQPQ